VWVRSWSCPIQHRGADAGCGELGSIDSTVLLFHLHFNVADVRALEADFVGSGFGVVARFGYRARVHESFGPEVSWEELDAMGIRLRLVELERGAVNIVLMRGRDPRPGLGQIGFVAGPGERDAILESAERLGLRTAPDPLRSFVTLDKRLDLELTVGGRFQYDDAAQGELRLERVIVACPSPERAEKLVRELLGHEAARQFEWRPGAHGSTLCSWSLSGSASADVKLPGAVTDQIERAQMNETP
jgi:hypothetical protein